MNPFDCGRYALEQGGQAIVRPNLDWCTERVEKESHSVINVKSTVAIFKQWSNISRLTAFGMTTIIPPFWSMENCSRTCQNGRIAAGRLPRPGLVFSIVASVFLLFDLSMERESATFAMTDKSPSASSSAVVASSIVDLLGAFASVFSFQGIHFAHVIVCNWHHLTVSNSNERSPSMNCRYFRIVIQSAPCATDSVRPSGLGRSLDHGEEKHSRVMLFGVTSDKTPNLGQMLIFIVLLENLSGAVLSITKLCYSSEGFQRAEQRPQTTDRCWCRVRNGQNPTEMIMQPPNLTVDSADLALAAFRAMLLFAARAHAVRAHFICSS
ncbi:DNA ligase [Trichinella spiralis]|uniref:DNA ligase n=1 Tax=Trichinella spiralis TaxID=6334 RepID=A0ABR3KBD8_TRISP